MIRRRLKYVYRRIRSKETSMTYIYKTFDRNRNLLYIGDLYRDRYTYYDYNKNGTIKYIEKFGRKINHILYEYKYYDTGILQEEIIYNFTEKIIYKSYYNIHGEYVDSEEYNTTKFKKRGK